MPQVGETKTKGGVTYRLEGNPPRWKRITPHATDTRSSAASELGKPVMNDFGENSDIDSIADKNSEYAIEALETINVNDDWLSGISYGGDTFRSTKEFASEYGYDMAENPDGDFSFEVQVYGTVGAGAIVNEANFRTFSKLYSDDPRIEFDADSGIISLSFKDVQEACGGEDSRHEVLEDLKMLQEDYPILNDHEYHTLMGEYMDRSYDEPLFKEIVEDGVDAFRDNYEFHNDKELPEEEEEKERERLTRLFSKENYIYALEAMFEKQELDEEDLQSGLDLHANSEIAYYIAENFDE